MSSERKYINYTIGIVIVFAILSLLATIRPSFIDEEIIKSLTLPIFLLSIISSLQLIVGNALQLCKREWEYACEDERYDKLLYGTTILLNQDKPEQIPKLEDEYVEKITQIRYDKMVYKKTNTKIMKVYSILSKIEIAALVIFLLSAILTPSFLNVDSTIVAYWSLTIMLLSSCFSSKISERYLYYIADKIDKNNEHTDKIDKEPPKCPPTT